MLSNTSWAHHDRTRAQTQINIHWLSLTSYFSHSLCVCVCAYVHYVRKVTASWFLLQKRRERIKSEISTPMKYYSSPFFVNSVGMSRLQTLPHSTLPALPLGKCKLSQQRRRSNCCNCCAQRRHTKKRSAITAIKDSTAGHTHMKHFQSAMLLNPK